MKAKFLMRMLILTLCWLSTAGCSKTRVVIQSGSPIPEECLGSLYVQTNKPIPVGIYGSNEMLMLDMGGYFLIHKNELAALVRAAAELKAVKTPQPDR